MDENSRNKSAESFGVFDETWFDPIESVSGIGFCSLARWIKFGSVASTMGWMRLFWHQAAKAGPMFCWKLSHAVPRSSRQRFGVRPRSSQHRQPAF